jgi:hypothetical protein
MACDHGSSTHFPSRHAATGSDVSEEQLCGAHRTALQVAPNAACSSSTRARGTTRFSQVGKQQSDSDVTGASGSAVVAQSVSAAHSAPGGGAPGSAGLYAGETGSPAPGSLQAAGSASRRRPSRRARVIDPIMQRDPRSGTRQLAIETLLTCVAR